MTEYFKNSDFELEYDEIFDGWYEIEDLIKIKELSRQLRTFFNYKMAALRYRFRTDPFLAENYIDTKFIDQKQEVEALTHEFTTILKKLKSSTQPLEVGTRSLFFNTNNEHIRKLSETTEKLFIIIHRLSEENIQDHPKFLKFVIVLAKNICLVKKILSAQFSQFYSELEINYHDLEGELGNILEKVSDVKINKSTKQLEERLTQ